MKKLLTTAAIMAATSSTAGGLSDPIIPADPTPQAAPSSGEVYLKGGIGGALLDPGYSNSDVFLDYHWFKKGMASDLVGDNTDLSGGAMTATVELGYLHPLGQSGFVLGGAIDYTHFGFEGSNTCQVDAKAEANPNWVRPDHTCFSALDDAASVSLLLGYESGPWQFIAGSGIAQANASQGWSGDIEGRGWFLESDEGVTLDGMTYTLEVKYQVTPRGQIGLEVQAFDFDPVETQHDWGNTQTDFDVVNTSLTYTLNF